MKKDKEYYFSSFYPDTSEEISDISSNSFSVSKPLGNNSVPSLSLLFADREYYSERIIPLVKKSTLPNLVFGDLLNKNALYGLVDEDLNSIYPIQENLKKIPSATQEPKLVLDFVADAFNQLNAYLATAALVGKISKDGPFYGLKATRAYVKPGVLYNYIEEKILNEFRNKINDDKKFSSKIKDAKTFNKYFIQFLKDEIKKGTPVTQTSILLSSNFSTFISGLVIDFKSDKADDDTLKFDKYWNDKDFQCFADSCKRFGFKIDVNVPWRIMIDLNSPAILQTIGNHVGYLQRYNIDSITKLFSQKYSKTINTELFYVKLLFYSIYNDIVSEFPYYEVDYNSLNTEDFNNQTIFERQKYKFTEYDQVFSDSYWVRVYTYLRNYEEKRNLKQQEFENIVREASNFTSVGRTDEAFVFVNKYFKQFKEVYYFSLQNNQNNVQQKAESAVLYDLVF